MPNYRGVFKDALTIAAKEKLRAIDAVHVAFAAHYHCERFVTTDVHFKNLSALPVFLIDLSSVS
ncbi:MAG: PIN domain-containing protein [Candidatus Omnitrophota bacterium]|jgi:predicted nucleic acid-binding protein|nr:MAG: PIN domain-containing protein [Candidatus Omnitrophota bacterium]